MLKEMKKSIMKILFKKELYELHNKYQAQVDDFKRRIKADARLEIQDLEKIYKIPHRIFNFYKNAEIIGIKRNKEKEELFVFKKREGAFVYIRMCGESYLAINSFPKINAKILEKSHTRGYCLFIEDILITKENVGNGSIAMEYLIKVAKEIGVPCIKGSISPVDIGHFDRLEHFYKKFGFKVNFNEKRTGGNIMLELNDSDNREITLFKTKSPIEE
ncbi:MULTISPECIES: hypothetical protein [Bacillus cereus group]|uniref:N-acetyltransferase domain-containing protein n=1 Tax=Bacillus proteolyticus TaxID=2026192 RepID=A0ABV3IFC1_9BACI|nr:hypothetical protein [Bacillus cereus group sp. N8]MBJ8107908.1 hypothetical protein [Bacillus cereus group sp. N8]